MTLWLESREQVMVKAQLREWQTGLWPGGISGQVSVGDAREIGRGSGLGRGTEDVRFPMQPEARAAGAHRVRAVVKSTHSRAKPAESESALPFTAVGQTRWHTSDHPYSAWFTPDGTLGGREP